MSEPFACFLIGLFLAGAIYENWVIPKLYERRKREP
jgi:hypothetical protein